MSTITRGTQPSVYWPGMKAFFGRGYKDKEAFYSQIFDEVSSDQAHEEFGELMPLGLGSIKAEGAPIIYDSISEGPRVRVVPYTVANGFIISREARMDGKYGKFGNLRSKDLGRSMKLTKEILAHRILNEAFDPNAPLADGQPLVSGSHAIAGGTVSNALGIAADISEAAIEDMMTQKSLLLDSRGHLINLHCKQLIIPPQLQFEAMRILKSVNQANTDGNNVNVLRAMGAIPKIVTTPYLMLPDAFFLQTDADLGLTCVQREKVSYDRDKDFDTHNHKYQAYERYAFVVPDFRCVIGSPGA